MYTLLRRGFHTIPYTLCKHTTDVLTTIFHKTKDADFGAQTNIFYAWFKCMFFKKSTNTMGKHFLERTDPTFVQDLKESIVHVNEVVRRINEHLKDTENVQNVTLHVMDTQVRPNVRKRKQYSDSGDVKVTWTQHGLAKSAMLEFKQRKSYKFDSLSKFQYPDVFVDSLSKFEKISNRGDTLGYVLTDQYMRCIFSTSMVTFQDHMIVKDQYFRSRRVQWCSLPKQYFHEGMINVCDMIIDLVTNFDTMDLATMLAKNQSRQLRLAKKRVKDLLHQLNIQRNIVQKLEQQGTASDTNPSSDEEQVDVMLFKRRPITT